MSLEEWQKENPSMKQDLKILYEMVLKTKPKIIAEVGTGHSTMTMALALKIQNLKNSKIYSTDIDVFRINYFQTKIDMALLSDYCGLFTKDSEQFFKDISVVADTIFIDSAHEYQKTLDEITQASKVLSTNGSIFVHDTAIGNVLLAIKEFLNQNKGWTYYNFPTPCGLGVLMRNDK
jgi:predicted O-methyltransferase YrrM